MGGPMGGQMAMGVMSMGTLPGMPGMPQPVLSPAMGGHYGSPSVEAMAMLPPEMSPNGMTTYAVPQHSLAPMALAPGMVSKQGMVPAPYVMAQHAMAGQNLAHPLNYGMTHQLDPRGTAFNTRYATMSSSSDYMLQGGVYYQMSSHTPPQQLTPPLPPPSFGHGGGAEHTASLQERLANASTQPAADEAQIAEQAQAHGAEDAQGSSWDCLYVTRLPRGMSEKEVFHLFAPYGRLREVQLLRRVNGNPASSRLPRRRCGRIFSFG